MKKYYLLILLISAAWSINAQCPPSGSFEATSQSEVDAFMALYPDCTELTGFLTITDPWLSSDIIVDLTPFSNLTAINGGLIVSNSQLLTNLNSLDNLSVLGSLELRYNSDLIDLSGLNNITSLNALVLIENYELNALSGLDNVTFLGSLEISENNQLDDISALGNLTSIADDFQLSNNFSLTEVNELSNLSSIGGEFRLESTEITSLEGLENLTFIGGGLVVIRNDNLTSLIGLNNLAHLEGNSEISWNSSLVSLDGLYSLSTIDGDLRIFKNDELTALDALQHITEISGDLQIIRNESLINFGELNELSLIGGNLNIHLNDQLSSINGLENVNFIGGDIVINNSDGLTTLDGLNNVAAIEGQLLIYSNPNLISLDGLNSLASTGEGIYISGNQAMTSLSGLENVVSINGGLDIRHNASLISISALKNIPVGSFSQIYIRWNGQLSACTIENLCAYLSTTANNVTIMDNAFGCTSPGEVIEACLPACPDGDLVFASQAELDAFASDYPHCTNLSGNLKIGEEETANDIENLLAFSNLISVGGDLSIFNTNLNDFSDLGSLYLGLQSIDGTLYIRDNSVLESLNGLEHIDDEVLQGLFIENNPNLSICLGDGICDYLRVETNMASILGNASGCLDRENIVMNCLPSSVDEKTEFIALFPNPTSGQVYFQNIEIEKAQIFSAQGKQIASYLDPVNELDLSTFPPGIYYVNFWARDKMYYARVVKR